MGDGEGPILRHSLQFVARAPRIRVEDFVRLIVVADDDAHVAADGLQNARFGEDAERHAPDDGDALVDLRLDAREKLFVVGILGAHALEDFGFHRAAHFADEDGVAVCEFIE